MAIDPHSLRIGNLVMSAGQVSEVQVINGIEKAFDQVYLEREEDFEWTEFSRIEPIDLTHEWLQRIGAIFPHHDFRCQISNLCFYWNPNGGLFLNDSGWNETISDEPIRYLHTLQNLIHALTGKHRKPKVVVDPNKVIVLPVKMIRRWGK